MNEDTAALPARELEAVCGYAFVDGRYMPLAEATIPLSGRVRSKHTDESLKSLGIEVLPPSGRGFILPTGKPSRDE